MHTTSKLPPCILPPSPHHSNHTHTHKTLPFFTPNNDTVSLIVHMMQEQFELTKTVLYIMVLTVFLDLFPKGPGEQIYRHRTRQNTGCPWTKHMSMFLVPACVRHWVHSLVSVHPLHLPALKNILNKLTGRYTYRDKVNLYHYSIFVTIAIPNRFFIRCFTSNWQYFSHITVKNRKKYTFY